MTSTERRLKQYASDLDKMSTQNLEAMAVILANSKRFMLTYELIEQSGGTPTEAQTTHLNRLTKWTKAITEA